ncbi:MAG: hypothetical protein KAH22_06600 [Thiotrichaceae bacterium]|nr:hypothetical protein [Thiotrichaceae bacterium]
MKRLLYPLLLILIGTSWLNSASANQPLDGSLAAKKKCPVLHSIRQQSNPNHAFLKIGQDYEVIGKNKVTASHYLIKGDFDQRQQGWVRTDCGAFSSDQPKHLNRVRQNSNAKHSQQTVQIGTSRKKQRDYLLALSWQPAFCVNHKSKKECRSLTPNSTASKKLSLHGLWPQPKNNAYCGVNSTHKTMDRKKQWKLLPKLPLDSSTRKKLAEVMPGYQSMLHRHEWTKHGSCYPQGANQYYIDSIALTTDINNSDLGKLLSNNIGKKIDAKTIYQMIDKSYGKGAHKRVQIRCDGKKRLTELWFNLSGKVDKHSVTHLLDKAPHASKGRCKTVLIK